MERNLHCNACHLQERDRDRTMDISELHTCTFLAGMNMTILDKGMSVQQFVKQKSISNSASGNEDAFYVADLGDIIKKYWQFSKGLPRVKPFYAMKCNSTRAVLQMLAFLGTGFACCSMAELDMVLRMGVPAADIVFVNPCKQVSHIRYAAEYGVRKMTFDCESELLKLAASYPQAEMILQIVTDNKEPWHTLSGICGVYISECENLLKKAKSLNMDVFGVSFHTGSRCKDTHSFHKAIEDARKVFDIGKNLGHQMRLLDIGGGFPGDSESRPTFEKFAEVIRISLDQSFPCNEDVQIIAEPGRFYVTSAFTAALNIVTKKVVTKKDGEERRQFSYVLNDGIFGSFFLNYMQMEETWPVVGKDFDTAQELFPSILWGPTCASEDKIVKDIDLPELEMGDWIIFPNMGAYSMSMTSNFNAFSTPKIYFVFTRKMWTVGQILKKEKLLQNHPQNNL
ncbi:ornithine decarboxylase isoform X2 [Xenopus tropicalis]|uniref:Ornithine decarboxylase n=1 Tax=Xenopus tropicalis TaxID=8364 RepID=A0A6I8R480_XENTR|nr:ornithine decarboxylase isoform X2 [Xenopus tropicalis]